MRQYIRTDKYKYEAINYNIINDVIGNDFKPLVDHIIDNNIIS